MAQGKYTGAFSKYGRGKPAFRRTKLTFYLENYLKKYKTIQNLVKKL